MRDLTEAEREALYVREVCPFCGGPEFVDGPRAGIMVNATCAHCGAQFNMVDAATRRRFGVLPFGQLLAPPDRPEQ